MNWLHFWEQQGKQQQMLDQVGRRGGSAEQREDFFKTYAAYIASQLQLQPDDVLLDVCCGNGLLTNYLAPYCKMVVGVDFSELHILSARKNYASDRLHFYCGNAMHLDKISELKKYTFTKSTLCFSFQYFESVDAGLGVVRQIFGQLNTHGKIYLADIPDRERWFVYYNSAVKLIRLIKQMLLQQNDMGKFWSEEELNFIAAKNNAKGTKIIQPEEFPYGHYRSDYLLEK